MTTHVYTMRGPIATLKETIMVLETVPRNPDSPIDRAIKNIHALLRHIGPDPTRSVYPIDAIESYVAALNEIADGIESTSLDTDTKGGAVLNSIKDLRATAFYIAKIEPEPAKQAMPAPKGVPGGYADGDAYRQPVESIQVPPSMRGEPASALEEPARQYSVEDQKRIDAGLKPFTAPQPTPAELLAASGTARMVKKDASKGEGIVQACAQIRGEIANNAHGDWRRRLLDHVRNIEDAAFSTDAPTFALNANGVPLDIEQVRLIGAIKEAQAQLLSLGVEVQSYLLAKQQRLRAICDEHPVEGTEARVTDDQQAAYKAYDDFCKATGYTWLDRGLGDVQVGVMSMVRAVAGPTS